MPDLTKPKPESSTLIRILPNFFFLLPISTILYTTHLIYQDPAQATEFAKQRIPSQLLDQIVPFIIIPFFLLFIYRSVKGKTTEITLEPKSNFWFVLGVKLVMSLIAVSMTLFLSKILHQILITIMPDLSF